MSDINQNKKQSFDSNWLIYFFFAPFIVLFSSKQSFYHGKFTTKEVIALTLGNLFYLFLFIIGNINS